MPDPPDPADLNRLHQRILDGDRLASEELSRLLIAPLIEEISRRFQGADEQLVDDGVMRHEHGRRRSIEAVHERRVVRRLHVLAECGGPADICEQHGVWTGLNSISSARVRSGS